MKDKIYNEEEKNFHVMQGIWENNNILFKMIKEDIDHLITQRLLSFLEAHPAIAAMCSKKEFIDNSVDCKQN
jgi:capsule polysaccharide modification protein KpsS